MKRFLISTAAVVASLCIAAPASAQVVQFAGSTTGCFGVACSGLASDTDFGLTYTAGMFNQASDPSGFLGVGGLTDNLGTFNLTGVSHTYTGDIFNLFVTFTQPGSTSGLFTAALQGTVMSSTSGSVFINFNNTAQTFTGTNGSVFSLAVNDVSVAAGGATQILSGQLQAAVPEPATWAMMLLGFGVMGVSLRRRRRSLPALMQAA